MLEYNEVVERKYIVYEGNPYEILSSHVFRKQQRKPVNAVKMKNLITGKVAEVSFHVSDKVEEADMSTRNIKYLYTNKDVFWFCEVNDQSKRFEISKNIIGAGARFLKVNSTVSALVFGERIIGIRTPVKVDLRVIEAFPAVKGDTAKGGNKQVTVETGATVTVPMFIKEGDILRINTETGEYTDRITL